MRIAAWNLCLALGLGLAACGDDAPVPPPRAAAVATAAAPSFVADHGDGARVLLREAELTADRLVLDVVASATGALHGASFRLTFDPAVVAYSGFAAGSSFGGSDIVLAKEAKPGLVVLAFSKLGAATPVDLDGGERVLATLTFAKVAAGQSRIAWTAARSRLADPAGKTIAVAFLGGTVTYP